MSEPARTDVATPWARVLGIAVGLSLAVGIVMLAFSWPSITAEPKNLPVGVVGADAQVDQLEQGIADQADGAVELIRYDDRDAAVQAIREREAYGAVVLGETPLDAPEILKATAAGAPVAALMDGLGHQMQAQIDAGIRTQSEARISEAQAGMGAAIQAAVQAALSGQQPQLPEGPAEPLQIPEVTVVVTDVVPFVDADPQGAGLSVAMFPLLLGGMLGGILLTLTVRGTVRRVVGAVVYSAAAGLVLSAVQHSWLGLIPSGFWITTAVFALAVGAIATTVTGLAGLFGAPGVPIAAVTLMLVANPISAAAVPVHFLLEPWGAIGQMLPPGAAGTLLRSVAYFPDADASAAWLLLGGWMLVGLVLTAIDVPARRARAAKAAKAAVPALA